MRFNRTISIYWFWLIVIAGVLSGAPVDICWDIWQDIFLWDVSTCWSAPLPNIANLYADALRGNSYFYGLWADKWILLHAAVSVVLAIIATVICRLWARRHRQEQQPDPRTFTLGGLLLAVTALACLFSLLASLGAIPMIYAVMLVFVVGRVATLLLAAIGL
jgi:hypothetical protein